MENILLHHNVMFYTSILNSYVTVVSYSAHLNEYLFYSSVTKIPKQNYTGTS